MRIVRYIKDNDPWRYGWILDESGHLILGPIEGDPFSEFRRLEAGIAVEDIQFLAPLMPSKIICVGRNFIAHAKEHDAEVPEIPLLFFKPPSSIITNGDPIILPPQSNQVEHEGELAVVIAKSGRRIAPEEALEYIFGYTIANDVTARDLQRSDDQWTRAKGFDTFCPIGPWIETKFDPADSLITCSVNGEMRQMASTRDMVFDVRQLIAFISSVMTLLPGDLILTGTPAGVGKLNPGDVVEVTIEGLGTLSNPVIGELIP